MVEVMHNMLLDATKVAFTFVAYIGIFANEVMTINNIQWLFRLGRGFQSSSMLK
jgi:hypothetical protein